jgi:hypothetical protein
MKTENNYRTIRILLPAHENAEDYTDKYGVCHTVEKGKSFINAQGELKLMEHYSI